MPSIIAACSPAGMSCAAATCSRSVGDGRREPALPHRARRAPAPSRPPAARRHPPAHRRAARARCVGRLVRLALLLGGERQEEARARRGRIERVRRLESARARPPSRCRPATRRSPRPVRLPRRCRAEQPDGVPIGLFRFARARAADRPARSPPSRGRPPVSEQDAPRPSLISISMSSGRSGSERRAASGAPGRVGAPSPR